MEEKLDASAENPAEQRRKRRKPDLSQEKKKIFFAIHTFISVFHDNDTFPFILIAFWPLSGRSPRLPYFPA